MSNLPRTAFKKGHIPWSKGKKVHLKHDKQFKKGMIPWNKGMTGNLSHMFGKRFKMNQPSWNKGKKMIGEHPMLGKHHSKETKEKMRKPHYKTRGSNNWKWKGGITSKDRLERINFQRIMQKQVFERDGYKCVMCEVKGNLQVDHIQPWAEYVEGRFNMNNCRTLCAKCHYQITFGRPMPESVQGWGHNLLKVGALL